MRRTFTLCIPFLLLPISVAHADNNLFHTDPSCWKNSRFFHSGAESRDYLSKISISQVSTDTLSVQNMEWVPSPNGAYRFTPIAKQREKPDPVSLIIDVERPYFLKIDVKNQGIITDQRWINEKLLFFRIWWGRIRGTDVVFDVESEEIRISDMVQDGSIAFEQFQKACADNGTFCKCMSRDAQYFQLDGGLGKIYLYEGPGIRSYVPAESEVHSLHELEMRLSQLKPHSRLSVPPFTDAPEWYSENELKRMCEKYKILVNSDKGKRIITKDVIE